MDSDTKAYHAKLFWLQSAARKIAGKHRVCLCCRYAIPGKNVEIWGDIEKRKAKYRNVIRCASVWICPVCANNITASRRDDLRAVSKALPGTVTVMITFTLSHHRSDKLSHTLTLLSDSWRSMTSGRSWMDIKSETSIAGYVRALEVTWGKSNGWHPHYHVLFWVYPETCISRMYKDLRLAWDKAVKGNEGDCSWEHATSITVCDGSVEEYVAKWGHEPSPENRENLTNWGKYQETARGPMKRAENGHYTPFQMYELYLLNGDPAPGFWAKILVEYMMSMVNQRQMTWSRSPNLRTKAGLKPEREEAAIVEGEESGFYLLATLQDDDWEVIVESNSQGVILDCCARGDIAMAVSIIRDLKHERNKTLTR